MANSNRHNPNRWNDNRNYNDYRGNDRNRNWESDSRRNTSLQNLHQGSWNQGGGAHEENYGLGDTSQGSGNYGHIDEGHGARYYGTGNYGGYFELGPDGNTDDNNRMYGPHSGKGPKGYTHSDEKIKDDVGEKLYHDSFIDASDIEVSVKDGEVTLSGTVESKQTKRRAEDCAYSVAGVKDVTNLLKTNRSTSSDSSQIGS